MKKLVFLAMLLSGCGAQKTVETKPAQPAPLPTPGGDDGDDGGDTGDKISYQKMQGYLNTYCQSCHASAQFMASEGGLRASAVKSNLWSKRMPLSSAPKALPENIRQQMIDFF